MVMKMHSYITVNGQLQNVTEQSNQLLGMLKEATKSVGGWEQAVKTATEKQAEIEAAQHSSESQMSTPPNGHEKNPIGTPKVPQGMSTSYVDVNTAQALRKRLTAVVAQAQIRGELPSGSDELGVRAVHNVKISNSNGQTFQQPALVLEEDALPEGLTPHPLIHHPDSQISDMAKDYSELQSELISSGPFYVKWPDNITWKNFAVYQLIPTLVYELEYPRTEKSVIFSNARCHSCSHFMR